MKFIDVLVTCPSRASAETIARVVVQERLAACANIGSGINSIYRWNGAIEETDEVPLLLKTRADLFDRLAGRVKEMHDYVVPCIIATTLTAIDPAYAKWLEEETKS
jgi:periplasmic divalent cation tolerance protein